MSKQLITSINYLRRGPCVIAILLLCFFMPPLTVQEAAAQDLRITAINADVAAGVDIATIIQNAVAAGLTVSQAVEAIVAAGVDPGRVVYIAIQANYSATDVVNGAANAVAKMGLSDTAFQAQISLIVSTALQGGASEGSIRNGLSLAGVSAPVIANAFAQAVTNPAPVFGYTTPYIPPRPGGPGGPGGFTGFIGGSGIGNRTGSRTRP